MQTTKRVRSRRPMFDSLEGRTLLSSIPPPPPPPVSLTVTTLADSTGGDQLSLRDAITAIATVHDQNMYVIDLTAVRGTIALTRPLPNLPANLIAINGPGASNLTIQGNNTFNILTRTNVIAMTVFGVTIQNGNANSHSFSNNGGGISANGPLTVSECAFYNDHADASAGGGIYTPGPVTVNYCTFSGDSASGGGGIYAIDTVAVNSCTFSSDSAGFGGGIAYECDLVPGATLTVNSCTFSGDSAGDGGGISYCVWHTGNTATVNGCLFSGNHASIGGGIFNGNGSVTVNNGAFYGNSASAGGGIFNKQYATLHMNNDQEFDSNTATWGRDVYNGGWLYADSLTVTAMSRVIATKSGLANDGTLIVT